MPTRTQRKGEVARQRVLNAVVDAVSRKGLANVSVLEVGEAAGMSSGHVLYYFASKDALFVEALKHMEAQLDGPRADIVAADDTALNRLDRYLALYLPTDPRDARWALWIEVWNRSVTDADLSALQLGLDRRWQDDLKSIVDSGIERSEFAPIVPDPASAIAAVLDGLAVRELTGGPDDSGRTLASAGTYCRALLGVS
jgi:AcrR family transcriptional regulator